MVTMFKPVRAPKEGRSPPVIYSDRGHGSKRATNRKITVGLLLFACFFLGYYIFTSESTAASLSSAASQKYRESIDQIKSGKGYAKEVLSDDSQADPNAGNAHDTNDDWSWDDEDDKAKDFKQHGDKLEDKYTEPDTQPSVDDVNKEKEKVEDSSSTAFRPKGWKPTDGKKSAPGKIKGTKSNMPPEVWSERPSFEKKLQHVIDLLPDELNMRELIRPVEGTGKEKLREMGLRTKAYKTYFEAWEALHLATDDEGATYVRDDVVQYLRSHQHKSDGDTDGVLAGHKVAHTIRAYESYRSFLTKFAELLFPWTSPYFADHMSLHAHFKKGGKGIVLTAGDDQAPYLLTTIYTFRQLGCELPIEVMYLGDQDLGEDYRLELESLPGVVTRDIAQMVNDEGWKLAGWAAKPFAILFSSFREVIFIDADSLFFRDPATLFEDPDYQETGALFFRDRLIMPEDKKRWLQQILPKPIPRQAKLSRFWTGESGHMQESGCIVVDKWRHFMALLLVTRMNGPDRDGNKDQGRIGVYDMVYGDKETFWLGWLLAGDEDYTFHQGDAGIMGLVKDPSDTSKMPADYDPSEHDENSEGAPAEGQKSLTSSHAIADNYTICAPQLLHLDLDGKPLWFNGWLLHNKFADRAHKKFAHFESYLVEPRKIRDPGAWQLAESNMCCLTSDPDKRFDFNEEEKATLKMIMDRATDVGMGDQR